MTRSRSSLEPPSSPIEASVTSSTRHAGRSYSRRAQNLVKKRKAELNSDGSETEESGEELLGDQRIKQPRREEPKSPASPSLSRTTRPNPRPAIPNDETSDSSVDDQLKSKELKENPKEDAHRGRYFSLPNRLSEPQSSRADSAAKKGENLASNHSESGPSTPTRNRASSRRLTPQSSPRDLSAYFANDTDGDHATGTAKLLFPSQSPKRPPGIRRMLTKAQSLGDNLGSPSNRSERQFTPSRTPLPSSGPSTPSKTPSRTLSLPISPLKSPSQSDASPLTTRLESKPGESSRRTYGRSRTFLEGKSNDQSPSHDQPGNEQVEDVLSESYAELRKRYEVDNTTELDSIVSGNLNTDPLQARAPQPVSDMRSKGENRRFLDELAYLTDGIADPATSSMLKRTSSIEILNNLRDEDWMTKMYMCGQADIVWGAFMAAREGDEAIGVISLLYIALWISSPTGVEGILQAYAEDCVLLVLQHVRRGETFYERETSKQSSTARKLHKVFSAFNNLWTTPAPTFRRLASYLALQLTSPNLWRYTGGHFLDPSTLSLITLAIVSECRAISKLCNAYEKTKSDTRPAFDVEYLKFIIKCFSTCFLRIVDLDPEDLTISPASLAASLFNGMAACSNMVFYSDQGLSSSASHVIVDSLQILACLTNASKRWTSGVFTVTENLKTLVWVMLQRDAIAKAESFDQDAEAETQNSIFPRGRSEDLLCLVLAVLIASLTEESGAAKSMSALKISATCQFGQRCARNCRCEDILPLHTHLIALFQQYQLQGHQENGLIISGYLAVVLAQLLVMDDTSQTAVLKSLPGVTNQDKVSGLYEALGELEGVHSIVQRKLMDEELQAAEPEPKMLQKAIQDLGDLMSIV